MVVIESHVSSVNSCEVCVTDPAGQSHGPNQLEESVRVCVCVCVCVYACVCVCVCVLISN